MTVFSSAPPFTRRVMTCAIRNGWIAPIIWGAMLREPLPGTRTAAERRDRERHQPHVAHQRPAGDVEIVEADHLRERNLAPSEHLPRPGHAWLEIQPLTGPSFDVLVLVEDERPRADEAHLSDEDVQKLRQLVESKAPQELADPRDARIVDDLEHPRIAAWSEMPVEVGELALPLVGVGVH